jgi:hypothetical protein
MRHIDNEMVTWWDREILAMMREYGADYFKRLAIWDVDWWAVAERGGVAIEPHTVADPRSRFEQKVHAWLARTQPAAASRGVRWIQRLLRVAGW